MTEEGPMRFPVGLLLLMGACSLAGQDQPILNEDIGIVDFKPLDYPGWVHSRAFKERLL